VVFSHGWLLTADSWEAQMVFAPPIVNVVLPMTVAVVAGQVNPGMATTWTPMQTILNSERNFRYEDFNIRI
jgi:hypothetical protein